MAVASRSSRVAALLLVLALLLPSAAQALNVVDETVQACSDPLSSTCAHGAAGLAVVAAGVVVGTGVNAAKHRFGNPQPQYQQDADGDGYGDEWIGPYKDYAYDLADKLNDPEDDFRGDGLKNIDEFRWLTIPVGPFVVTDSLTLFQRARLRPGQLDRWKRSQLLERLAKRAARGGRASAPQPSRRPASSPRGPRLGL